MEQERQTTPPAAISEAAPGKYDHMGVGLWLLRVIHGALIGAGAILPGISGGVLCVLFGIYRPMMALLAHPIKTFRIYYKLFIPVLLGWAVGFFALAGLVNLLMEVSSAIAVSLFIGLIVGMIPSLYRDAGKYGHRKTGYLSMFLSFVVLFGFLLYLQQGVRIDIEGNAWWFFFCGIIWGLSLVVPGLSSSSILIFMGLYQEMTAGISRFDLGVLIPLVLGILCTALLSARFVNRLFERHHTIAYHAILGIVIASTLLIVPLEFKDATEVLLSIVCAVLGFLAAWGMDRYGQRVKPAE